MSNEIAEVLEDAANILEARGFTTSKCYDKDTGGHCALGAIARAVYPHAADNEIDVLAMEDVSDWSSASISIAEDPRFNKAVAVAAKIVDPDIAPMDLIPHVARSYVYEYNDAYDRKAEEVVALLRKAAEAARES